ncbi:MAG: hypothetical protein AAFV53_12030, partial [Myxococcota bacterium]
TVEQRMNAAAIDRMGIGRSTSFEELSAEEIQGFLRDADTYAAATRQYHRDGRREALEILEQWMVELTSGDAQRVGIA